MRNTKKMRYIGITGKRGIGRDKFGWLIGATLEELTHEQQGRIVDQMEWQDKVLYIRGQMDPPSSHHTCITSFAAQIEDQAMLLCGSTFGLDWKSNPGKYFVDIDEMEVIENPDPNKVTPLYYFRPEDGGILSIEDFIIYYGETIKNAYGKDIWTKVAASWMKNKMEDPNDPTTTIIFTDVKTDAEAEFILSKGGYLIEAICPEREKNGGYDYHQKFDSLDDLKRDGKVETFVMTPDFEHDEYDARELALRIYKHFHG